MATPRPLLLFGLGLIAALALASCSDNPESTSQDGSIEAGADTGAVIEEDPGSSPGDNSGGSVSLDEVEAVLQENGPATQSLTALYTHDMRFDDGSTVQVAVSVGGVFAFDGADPAWEAQIETCAEASGRDAYIPIEYRIVNTTDGFEVPTTFYKLQFANVDRGTRNLQFWQADRGCQPPDQNFGNSPLSEGEARQNILLREGGELRGQAAMILVNFFTPNAPDGSFNDPAFSYVHRLLVGSTYSPDLDGVPISVGDEAPSGESSSAIWTVDQSSVVFDQDCLAGACGASFAGVRLDAELAGDVETTMVGRTPDVSGEFVTEGSQILRAELAMDWTDLQSAEGLFVALLQSALGSDSVPTGTIRLVDPVSLPGDLAPGQVVEFEATGELEINGVSNTVSLPFEARVESPSEMMLIGAIDIPLASYGLATPASPLLVSTSDAAVLELQLLLLRN